MLILCLAFVALSFRLFAYGHSPDLMATWLAGHFYGQGDLSQVYPADEGYFSMSPPSDWWPYLVSQGREGSVYPFVYPPLWAVLSSWMVPHVSMTAFQAGASLVNPALLAAMIVLAARAAGLSGGRLRLAVLLGLGTMLVTLSGFVALEQNQPQILVSFLIVAAIERERAGRPTLAGAALALAAAIKLYPAILALLWLATGRTRAGAAFVLIGGALGLASVALAGWPLHAQFLHLIGLIRETVVMTSLNYGFDPSLAQFLPRDQQIIVLSADAANGVAEPRGWTVMAKGPLWSTLSSLALAALVVGAVLVLRRKPQPDILVWPAVLIFLSLLSPLAWVYHYLPALAFFPVLLVRLRPAIAIALAVLLLTPTSLLVLVGPNEVLDGLRLPQLVGTAAMLVMGLAMAFATRSNKG